MPNAVPLARVVFDKTDASSAASKGRVGVLVVTDFVLVHIGVPEGEQPAGEFVVTSVVRVLDA
jgi:hypothetical protein